MLTQSRKELEAARAELERLRNDPTATDEQLKNAKQAVENAAKKFAEYTAVGATIANAGRKINSWSAGSVSVEQEQAAIKFGKALDALKGNLREEAYKKDHSKGGAAQLKDQYDLLKSQPINEYAEGWDEIIIIK